MQYKHIAFFITMSLGVGFVSPTLADLNDGLVVYYPFDGNAQDASGNGHNATGHGATLTADRFGNADSAYNFDGVDDRLEVSNSDDLKITNRLTVATFFKLDSPIPWMTAPIVGKWGATTYNTAEYALFVSDEGQIGFAVSSKGTDILSVTTPIFPFNQWHHLVGVFDGLFLKLYVDGVQVAEKPFQSSIHPSHAPLVMGSYNPQYTGAVGPLNGQIDEVRIYNRALSDFEIKDLYGDCQHASYNPKERTLSIPFVELPLIDVWSGQPTGKVELFSGVLKQKYKTTEHFRLLSKTVLPITNGSSSSCPATYSFDTGVLSIPYIDVPTSATMGGGLFDSSEIEVFKATMTWEPQKKVFVVKEIEKRL